MICQNCNGLGYTAIHNSDDDILCKHCDGTGVIMDKYQMQELIDLQRYKLDQQEKEEERLGKVYCDLINQITKELGFDMPMIVFSEYNLRAILLNVLDKDKPDTAGYNCYHKLYGWAKK